MMGLVNFELHPRALAWLRISLPVLAIGLLASLFMLQDTYKPASSVMIEGNEVKPVSENDHFSGAKLVAVTEDGISITFTGAIARTSDTDSALLSVVDVIIELASESDSERHTVRGGRAVIDNENKTLMVDGGASIESTGGFNMNSEAFLISLKEQRISSLGELTLDFPGGRGKADRMELIRPISASGEAAAGEVLKLTGDVVVVFDDPGG